MNETTDIPKYTEHQETLIVDNFLDDYEWFRKYCELAMVFW